MSRRSVSRQRLQDVVDNRPLRGGLTGIGLVALATTGTAVGAALLVALILLISG